MWRLAVAVCFFISVYAGKLYLLLSRILTVVKVHFNGSFLELFKIC